MESGIYTLHGVVCGRYKGALLRSAFEKGMLSCHKDMVG